MAYRIWFTVKATKDLERLDNVMVTRITKKLSQLADNVEQFAHLHYVNLI